MPHVSRAEPLERYQALPLPTTKDEHWRFTDLAGFDPDAWAANGAAEVATPPSLLKLDVAGVAHVGESGIEIERIPDGNIVILHRRYAPKVRRARV